MSETPKSKFSMWFNCQSENEQHKYWSVSEITVDEVLKLYDYAMDEKNLIKNYKGNNAIKIRAKMFPAKSYSLKISSIGISETAQYLCCSFSDWQLNHIENFDFGVSDIYFCSLDFVIC